MTPEELRKINLLEALLAEAEARGQPVLEPATEEVLTWSEAAILAYFRPEESESRLPCREVPTFPTASEGNFKKWFPGLAISKTQCSAARFRVVCFPNAGSAEDIYTSEGTGARRTSSPLLEWCRLNSAECLAVQPPGRNMRRDEAPLTSPQALADALLPVIASQLISTPYAVIGHSVGTWCAYEFLMLARKMGLPMPRVIFFSAMASPDLAVEARPWRCQSELSEEAFKALQPSRRNMLMENHDLRNLHENFLLSGLFNAKSIQQLMLSNIDWSGLFEALAWLHEGLSLMQEECRGWDVNEVVFLPALWGSYHSLMRADFTLFDSYRFQHQGEPVLPCPIVAFHGANDRRISQSMVGGWRNFTSASFEQHAIESHHLWPLEKGPKQIWLQKIAQKLAKLPL